MEGEQIKINYKDLYEEIEECEIINE